MAYLDPTIVNGGKEIDTLKPRFDAFVRVANTDIPFVSNGFDRLNLPDTITLQSIESLNTATIQRAAKRSETAKNGTIILVRVLNLPNKYGW